MSKLTTALQAAAVIAAAAVPATATARPITDPLVQHHRIAPARNLTAPPTPLTAQVIVRRAPTPFDWSDAAVGAGATLLVIGVGGAGLRTRRRVHPQVMAG